MRGFFAGRFRVPASPGRAGSRADQSHEGARRFFARAREESTGRRSRARSSRRGALSNPPGVQPRQQVTTGKAHGVRPHFQMGYIPAVDRMIKTHAIRRPVRPPQPENWRGLSRCQDFEVGRQFFTHKVNGTLYEPIKYGQRTARNSGFLLWNEAEPIFAVTLHNRKPAPGREPLDERDRAGLGPGLAVTRQA